MLIVYPDTPGYDNYREISNARFDLRPSAIYYCETIEHVQRALSDATTPTPKIPVRVRSGGHHHEGMSSGDKVYMIDLSKFENIDIAPDGQTAWIGVGAKLANVYGTLFGYKRLIPGGGCGDVRVGGLVQGGGWGPYSRALGMTCDHVLGFRMVSSDGTLHEVTGTKPRYNELFRAVCGAGGGNFGVVTELQFRLAPWEDQIWQFTLGWVDPKLAEPVIVDWMQFPDDHDQYLTSFARVNAPGSGDPPVIVAGFYLGKQAAMEAALRRLLKAKYDAAQVSYSPVNAIGKLIHPEYQPGPDLKNTCAGDPFPHKVSSCFPKDGFGADAVAAITKYVLGSDSEANARRYLSFHSMGGKIRQKNDFSCFAYRDKPFMLQYQAWWKKPTDPKDNIADRCLLWLAKFRDDMKKANYTEGSFINFPDKDLVDANDPLYRRKLLEIYYRGAANLQRLISVKAEYDKHNYLDFPMGIPTSY